MGVNVTFAGHIAGDTNTFRFVGNGVEFIAIWNPADNGMHGNAWFYSRKQAFVLEVCGQDGHVWKTMSPNAFGEDLYQKSKDMNKPIEGNRNDNRTFVIYYVKVYYTYDFAASTPSVLGFVLQMIAVTNQGYVNSNVPLVAKLLCIELTDIGEDESPYQMLSDFTNMKIPLNTLRGSADVASLLVNSLSGCGIGYQNTIASGLTLSVVQKNCASQYYSFGHAVGHNIGLQLDPANAFNFAYPYAHGHLIDHGIASTGARTIMAYPAPNHYTRVNYYSNPNVIYPATGTATGVVGVSENAALLMFNRFALANVGDESLEMAWGDNMRCIPRKSTTTISTATTTTTTTTTTTPTTLTTTTTTTKTTITTTTTTTTSTTTTTK